MSIENLYRNITPAFSAEIHDQGSLLQSFLNTSQNRTPVGLPPQFESTAALWSSKFTAPGRINLDDNSARNHVEAAFAPFSQVIEDIDVVEKPYGAW